MSAASIGDNSGEVLNATAQGQLRSIIERVERLELEKAEVADQIKAVFAEAKGNGFDPKILRRVVRWRKQDRAKRQEEEAILDLYLSALGELDDFEPAPIQGPPAGQVTVTLSGPGMAPITATAEEFAAAAAMVRGEDDLYAEAVAIVRRDLKGSASYLQRRLQLGYNRAAALIERMQQEGVLGPPNHAGKREVLPPGGPGGKDVPTASNNGDAP